MQLTKEPMKMNEYLEALKPLEEDAVNTFQAGKKPTQKQLRARFAALLAKEIINGEFDELITDLCIDSDLEGIRQCSQCGQLMLDGYVVGGEHYCSKKCLHKNYTEKDWKKMSAAGPDDNYYTDWIEE